MKKRLIIILSLICLFSALCCLLSSCGCAKDVKTYTVTFDGNGGELVRGLETQEVLKGESATPPVYEKEGYALSFDKDYTNIQEDVKITAVWTKVYKVTFNGNGGTWIEGEEVQYVPEGEGAVAPVYIKQGYALTFDTDFSEITSDTEVNAVWKNYYTVIFDGNGGTLVEGKEEQIVIEGESAVAPVYENEGLALTFDQDFSCVTSDMYITAVWRNFISVTLDTNYGYLRHTNLYVVEGVEFTLPSPTLGGYTFTGWTLDGQEFASTNTLYDDALGGVTLVATWEYQNENYLYKIYADKTHEIEMKPTSQLSGTVDLSNVSEVDVTRIKSFGNSSITALIIPETVTEISEGALANCTRLNTITVRGENFKVENNGLYTADGTRYIQTVYGALNSFGSDGKALILNDVETIDEGAIPNETLYVFSNAEDIDDWETVNINNNPISTLYLYFYSETAKSYVEGLETRFAGYWHFSNSGFIRIWPKS